MSTVSQPQSDLLSTSFFSIHRSIGDALFDYVVTTSGRRHVIAAPVFEIDGKLFRPTTADLKPALPPRELPNGCVEHTFIADTTGGLTLHVIVRVAPDSPVLRFRFEMHSDAPRSLTKSAGRDNITYASISLQGMNDVAELRLSAFSKLLHTFLPDEVAVADRHFEHSASVMGPILLASASEREGDRHQILFAYEHGSTWPDAYLQFELTPGRTAHLRAVKGNYTSGQVIAPDSPFKSIWFEFAAVDGSRQSLADHYRYFVLHRFAEHPATRQPAVFYNTWNHQERIFNWHKRPYLADMNQERMLKEIDVAHKMGINVFVIDTGWYSRTGDWRVNTDRFPDALATIRQRLEQYGMRLGLWFDNAAAVSSSALTGHAECVMSKNNHRGDPHPVWETEASYRMCIVSRYADAWADEMIRLHHETGVTYFKWDAIGQYGCDDPNHDHGDASISQQERAERFSFLLPLYMSRVAARVARAVPGAICDFDMTETHRCLGLAFLETGKFFLINNGPYYWDYNLPKARIADGNANLLFHPGPARTWFMRAALAYDKWIPSTLLLTHFLPDDPIDNQDNAVASLVLGQNGIWGDLPAVSDAGVSRFAELLAQYQRVRDDVAHAPPRRQGIVGGEGEVHEKINPANGRGVVCVFATSPGTHTYVTDHAVSQSVWHTDGVDVQRLADNRARIVATFTSGQNAKLVVFG